MLQDALITLPHHRYGEYLERVYARMATMVRPDASVMEIGVRPEDRGVISRRLIPHRSFVGVDRNPRRGELVVDALHSSLVADVIISTAVLHHTDEADVPWLLVNLRAPLLMFSGPSADRLPELFGDHRWHLEIEKLRGWLQALGYAVTWERIGMSEPYSELLVIASGPR